MKVEYDSNNSGGAWWITDQNWKDLESAGWKVEWVKDNPDRLFVDGDGRFLGALATNASREGLTLGQAIVEWEGITGQRAADAGCSCCGHPHSFTFTGDNGEHGFNFVDPYDDDDWGWSDEYEEEYEDD